MYRKLSFVVLNTYKKCIFNVEVEKNISLYGDKKKYKKMCVFAISCVERMFQIFRQNDLLETIWFFVLNVFVRKCTS